ncbi:hypothetical protein E3P99_04013 [Wallemia hederae]|uniref:Acetolactate synthase n=1 Tax=Wallemia hederae TaxID=1540922 RepID=A0A4T0FBE8_9BASI|nr:hypothetical protein E3P99_04013 [Wallemia hederae]
MLPRSAFAKAAASNSRRTLYANKAAGFRFISSKPPVKDAASIRPQPSPSFQQAPPLKAVGREVQSNTTTVMPWDLDDSFVGMSGGEIFSELMLRHKVKHVFGYPGGAILPVFDAIYNSPNFDFILPRHEQGAGHMAEGYARITGKPGVVLVTSGPGATNTITAMQDALSDGLPMVVFTGQVATSAIGSDAFQEADVIGISRSCTKWNVMIQNVAEIPRRINEAFKIATSGRPGPVLVDLPKDITASICKEPIPSRYTQPKALPPLPNPPILSPSDTGPDLSSIERAAELINLAKRPVIYAGAGLLNSEDGPARLRELSNNGNIPVTTTLQGLGSFDELDPKSLHMLGMHGSAYANLAMQEADLIIALGARFDDRVTGKVDTFAPAARAAALQGRGGIIHFEVMPKNINKVVQANVAVSGDVTQNLGHLLPHVRSQPRGEWFDKIATWKEKYPFIYEKSDGSSLMKPQEVIEELDGQSRGKKDDFILTTGVGQHQMWAAQHYRWTAPRTMVTSGGLGTMGFGLPAAIGAKVAAPNKTVVDIDGDASFSMTAMELQTASQFNIGVKVIVLDNAFQGMVLQWQDLFYDNRYSHSQMINPDFCMLANSMGVHAIKCDNATDLPKAMEEFLAHPTDRPVLLHAKVVKNEHCYPMVPAGKALHEQTLHPLLMKKD